MVTTTIRKEAPTGDSPLQAVTNRFPQAGSCEIERFCQNFWPTGYLRSELLAVFKKFSSPQTWRPFRIFEFLPKIEKYKFASISLTVRDRAILSKFLTHWISEKCTIGNFQKKTFIRNHTTSRCFILIYNVKPEVDFSCKIG